MKIKITFTYLFFFLISSIGQGQEVKITSVPIAVDRSFTNIVGMCQDRNDFLWLADNYNGLYRYDGNQLTSYKSSPSNPNSLISDNLECLYPAANGNIWIGSFSDGLDNFDPESGIFTHYGHSDEDPGSLVSNNISALLEDRYGILWVGTNRGLDTLNRKTGKFDHINIKSDAGIALNQANIRSLYEDKNGTIWIGCGNPFNDHPNEKLFGGLYKFDKSTQEITRYFHKDNDQNSLIDNRVRALFEDSRGNFWVGTAGDGLHIMNRKNGSFQRFINDPKNPQKLSRPPVNMHSNFAQDHITFITEDIQGCIWIGTYAGGINRFNPKTQKLEYFGTKAEGSFKLTKDDFWQAYKTRDNLLWLAGWEPTNENEVLFKVSTLPIQTSYTRLGDNTMFCINGLDDKIWIYTKNGFYSNDKSSAILLSKINKDVSERIFFMESTSRNNLWMPTLDGLQYYNKKEDKIIRYIHDEEDMTSLSSNKVISTLQLSEKSLLVLTTMGFDLMDIDSGTFRHLAVPNMPRISYLNKDKTGTIWIGTFNGLKWLDVDSLKLHDAFDSNGSFIKCIFTDSQNKVWVGTYRSGLFVNQPGTSKFTQVQDETLIIENDLLYNGITEDDNHFIWLNTDKGLIQFDPKENTASLFGISHGIDPKGLNLGLTYKSGSLYMTNSGGYYHFQIPKKKNFDAHPLLSGLIINNVEIKPTEGQVLSSSLSTTSEISLKYNQGNFAIKFSKPDFITQESEKRLIYKLENYDESWRKSGDDKMAHYYNMPPGSYLFKLKSANLYGGWVEKSLKIIIHPTSFQFSVISFQSFFRGYAYLQKFSNSAVLQFFSSSAISQFSSFAVQQST